MHSCHFHSFSFVCGSVKTVVTNQLYSLISLRHGLETCSFDRILAGMFTFHYTACYALFPEALMYFVGILDFSHMCHFVVLPFIAFCAQSHNPDPIILNLNLSSMFSSLALFQPSIRPRCLRTITCSGRSSPRCQKLRKSTMRKTPSSLWIFCRSTRPI